MNKEWSDGWYLSQIKSVHPGLLSRSSDELITSSQGVCCHLGNNIYSPWEIQETISPWLFIHKSMTIEGETLSISIQFTLFKIHITYHNWWIKTKLTESHHLVKPWWYIKDNDDSSILQLLMLQTYSYCIIHRSIYQDTNFSWGFSSSNM